MLGLNDEQVKLSRAKYGSNILSKKKGSTFFKLLLESFSDPIIKILLIALAIKVVFLFKDFDWYETLGILIAIFLASFISSISEYGSNKAFERLMEESSMLSVNVYRNNKLISLAVSEIVVDDTIKLTSGDKVPADSKIISGYLYVDESFITGESKEVFKKCGDILYSGSTIYKGDATLVVNAVGDNTFIGGISLTVQEKGEESPLKKRLRTLAKSISILGYIGAILASIAYLFMQIVVKNNFDLSLIISTITDYKLMFSYLLYALTLSVTIIIMAVPEGLPMMITLVLSSNMKKMLKDNVLVRKLVGIETSGSLNVLLCDKTGTLTEGSLKVKYLINENGDIFDSLDKFNKYPEYKKILSESLFLNNECEISNKQIISGNQTDKAIKEFVLSEICQSKIISRKEFSSEDKYSYVQTEKCFYFKGASEVLLSHVTKYLDSLGHEGYFFNKEKLEKQISYYTSLGYRVLIDAYGQDKDMKNLVFISIIVISDVIRKEAYSAIKEIQSAGIKVVMITGDAKKTAVSIASDLGLINNQSLVLTHDELTLLTDNDLMEKLKNISVIARALPQDKSRLVSLYKNAGFVVGMTGDGVNDALALKKSDVAFALGSGSEVAKESSDIVILDNNIKSISNAILYGRTIFKSIRKFVTYQLTVNICALVLSIVGTLIGITSPITIIQMLWLNMIMDTFAGLAFSYEPPLKEYMYEGPKSKNEKIINKYMLNQIIVNGIYSSLLCILFLKLPFFREYFRSDSKYLMTAFFALFIFLGINNSFLSRTPRKNLFAGILQNKVFLIINLFIFVVQIFIIYNGGDIFRTYGLLFKELLFTLALSFSIIPIDLIRKTILKKRNISLGF